MALFAASHLPEASKLRLAAVWLPKTADPKKDATMAMSRPEMEPQKLDFTGVQCQKTSEDLPFDRASAGFRI